MVGLAPQSMAVDVIAAKINQLISLSRKRFCKRSIIDSVNTGETTYLYYQKHGFSINKHHNDDWDTTKPHDYLV